MVRDGSNMCLYRNGTLLDTDVIASPGNITDISVTNPLYLGDQYSCCSGTQHFGGILDDISIWDQALTTPQIVCLMNTGVVLKLATAFFFVLNLLSLDVADWRRRQHA